MAKQTAQHAGAASVTEAARRKARRQGWLIIIAVTLATLMLFVLGTIDEGTRYDWIKL